MCQFMSNAIMKSFQNGIIKCLQLIQQVSLKATVQAPAVISQMQDASVSQIRQGQHCLKYCASPYCTTHQNKCRWEKDP